MSATSDSRQVQPGSLFVAIPGSRYDGTGFIPQAVEAGAVAVVAPPGTAVQEYGAAAAWVHDPYAAAGRIAELMYDYPARDLRLFAVTGTNGKTTCALVLRALLNAGGRRTGLISTIYYDCGEGLVEAERTTPTPFELQELLDSMRENAVTDVVTEVSSHAMSQQRVGSTMFDGMLFTNLTADHLDYHGSMENYYQAKKRLFTHHRRTGAPAVINVDDPYGRRLVAELKDTGCDAPVTVGAAEESMVRIMSPSVKAEGSFTTLVLKNTEESRGLSVNLPGLYNLRNVVEAAVLVEQSGVAWETVQNVCARFQPAPGRLERIFSNGGPVVFVDYAHTPDALQHVLEALKDVAETGRLVVVVGCGGDRDPGKRPQMARIAEDLADSVYLTSDNPRSEAPEDILTEMCAGLTSRKRVTCVVDRREAIEQAVTEAQAADVILIAGKGHETYQEMNEKKYPFDDRAVAREALRQAGWRTPVK